MSTLPFVLLMISMEMVDDGLSTCLCGSINVMLNILSSYCYVILRIGYFKFSIGRKDICDLLLQQIGKDDYNEIGLI